MKKIITLFLAVIMIFAATSALAADITVLVNGEEMTFDRQPVLDGETVLIPYRFVVEKLGATVSWFGDIQTIFTNFEGLITTIQINNDKMFIDDAALTLEKAPVLDIDRTLVPAAVIENSVGATVEWNAETSTVTIQK